VCCRRRRSRAGPGRWPNCRSSCRTPAGREPHDRALRGRQRPQRHRNHGHRRMDAGRAHRRRSVRGRHVRRWDQHHSARPRPVRLRLRQPQPITDRSRVAPTTRIGDTLTISEDVRQAFADGPGNNRMPGGAHHNQFWFPLPRLPHVPGPGRPRPDDLHEPGSERRRGEALQLGAAAGCDEAVPDDSCVRGSGHGRDLPGGGSSCSR